jgi:hypothetical protein
MCILKDKVITYYLLSYVLAYQQSNEENITDRDLFLLTSIFTQQSRSGVGNHGPGVAGAPLVLDLTDLEAQVC